MMCKEHFASCVKSISYQLQACQRCPKTMTTHLALKLLILTIYFDNCTSGQSLWGYNSLITLPFSSLLPPPSDTMTPPDDDPKSRALYRHGVLHPHPERVSNPLFDSHPFFDPRDLVQVKYEMLRRVHVDGRSVSEAAVAAGLSRPTFYSVRAAFEDEGLPGLLPAKKGPRRAHKLTDDILALLEEWRRAEPDLDGAAMAERLRQQRDLAVHPRSIQRALDRRRKKKGAS